MALLLETGDKLLLETGSILLKESDSAVSAPTITVQPSNSTVDENTLATFTVTATGTGTLLYQWYDASDDSVISGETAATYDFTALEADTGNTYYVIVTDDVGATQSDTVALTVTALTPTITAQPSSDTVDENTTATFTVSATASSGALSYQWYLVGTGALGGEIAATLDFTALEADTGNQYYVDVTDSNGTIGSSTVTLTVTALAPTITVQPTNQAEVDGDLVTFTIAATASVGGLTYQWYETTAGLLVGETASTLDFVIALPDDGNSYYCIVSDDNGSIQSNTALLGISEFALSGSVTPIQDAAIAGATVTFTAVPSGGSGTITYQWYEETAGLLAGETAAALAIVTTTGDDGNRYYCAISDDFVTYNTDWAALAVYPILTVGVQPSAVAADAGDVAIFSATPVGTAPYSYQWYSQDGILSGETAATLAIEATPERALDYYCVMGDSTAQTVQTNNAALTVTIQSPVFLIQPADTTVNLLGDARFAVSVKGYRGLAYQWAETGVGDLAGETGPSLLLEELTLQSSGRSFTCTVSDGYGNSVVSNTATLTMIQISLTDNTEPGTPSIPDRAPRVIRTQQDHAGLVRAAEGPRPQYYDEYRFSGRTFRKRDVLTNER